MDISPSADKVAEEPEMPQRVDPLVTEQMSSPAAKSEVFAPSGGLECFGSVAPPTKRQKMTDEILTMPQPRDDSIAPTWQVQVFIGGFGQPFVEVRMPSDTAVGNLIVAADKLGVLTQPICAQDTVGQSLPLSAVVHQGQKISLMNAAIHSEHESVDILIETLRETGLHRADILLHQQAWVAFDEMRFYLRSMMGETNPQFVSPVHIHDTGSQGIVFCEWMLDQAQSFS